MLAGHVFGSPATSVFRTDSLSFSRVAYYDARPPCRPTNQLEVCPKIRSSGQDSTAMARNHVS
jgi:hypothetical protein